MTIEEIKKLPSETIVRIKENIDCHPIYKEWCKLTHANSKGKNDNSWKIGLDEYTIRERLYEDPSLDEYTFGIDTGNGVCYEFPSECYEVKPQE